MADYYIPGTPAVANTLARAENITTELTTIKASFDKIPEQVSLEQDRAAYALDTGVANAYLVAMPGTWTSYVTGASLRMKAVNANTGAATINVDSLGVKSIKRFNGDPLVAADIPAGSVLEFHYDGTNFQLAGGPATITNAIIGPGSSSDNAIVRYNGTTGKAAQNTGVFITDNDKLGIGTASPAGELHVKEGSSGASPHVDADNFIIENAGNAGMSILTPDAAVSCFYFGSPSDTQGGFICYAHDGPVFRFGTGIANGAIRFDTGNFTQAMELNASGELVLASTFNGTVLTHFGVIPKLQQLGDGHHAYHVIYRFNDNNDGSAITLGKSRSNTVGTNTIVQDDDTIGSILFQAADGVDFDTLLGTIRCVVDDSSPVASSIGARLVFTTSRGLAGDDILEAMRINSLQNVGIGTATPDGRLHVHTATAGAVTAVSSADDLVVENSAGGGISILTPDANLSCVSFGSPTKNDGAIVCYQHSALAMTVGTNITNGILKFGSGLNIEAMRIDKDGLVGIGATAPLGLLHIERGSAGAISPAVDADDLVIENSTDCGLSIMFPDADVGCLNFGTPSDPSQAFLCTQTGNFFIGTNHPSGAVRFGTDTAVERLRISNAGMLLIGTNAQNNAGNSQMTVGLTINQAGADNEILALKSSDVAHGITGFGETDTFGSFIKIDPTGGGLTIRALRGGTDPAAFILVAIGGTTENTDKDATASGTILHAAYQLNGTGREAVGANGNIFVVKNATNAKFLVDADGDLYADGTTGSGATVGLFDGEEDVALCRAFDLNRAEADGIEDQLVRTEWDDWASAHKDRLVDLRIIGADGPNGERGLVNVTQLQRLHNGAICQLHTALMETQNRLARAERALAALPAR